MSSDKVHIVFRLKGNPVADKFYYQRDGTQLVEGRHVPVPEITFDVRAPLTLHARPFAVSVRDRWRKVFGNQYDIFIEAPDGTGPLLEPREVAQAPAPDRVPHRAGDVLIVPGNPPRNGFYIRFPNTTIESLWSESAEEVYKKLLNHPLSGELIPLAEKYLAPSEPIVDPREIQRSLKTERYGRIRRPDLG
jgi:hypothetical protein